MPAGKPIGQAEATGQEAGIPLRCPACGLPFAVVRDGALVIQSKHHGDTHINSIPLAELARLLGGPSALTAVVETV